MTLVPVEVALNDATGEYSTRLATDVGTVMVVVAPVGNVIVPLIITPLTITASEMVVLAKTVSVIVEPDPSIVTPVSVEPETVADVSDVPVRVELATVDEVSVVEATVELATLEPVSVLELKSLRDTVDEATVE